MQERQVTIGGETLRVPIPFFVLATQNPIEQEGTYPLPEAQLDRFLLKLKVGYPSKEDELKLLDGDVDIKQNLTPISSLSELQSLQSLVQQIYVDPKVKDYIVNLVAATRGGAKLRRDAQRFIALGASPRASLAMHIASRALALVQGSYFVTPQHVRSLAFEVLRHRIVLSFEAEASGKTADDVITELLESVEVP
jgi:MoxR-like ATPase